MKWAFLAFCLAARAWPANVNYSYQIDRTALPAETVHRKITLLLSLGNCTGCSAQVDGIPVGVTWLAATNQCMLSTAGTNVSVTGLNWTGGGTGACAKATLHQNKKWAYSFTWDDSRDSVVPNALPVFNAWGYRAGMAINSGLMGTPGYMSWPDLDQLYNAGWGILNHSQDHLNITAANANAQLDPTKAAIEARYPGYKNTYFVYPYNDIQAWATVKAKGYLGAEAETGEDYADNWPIDTNPQASWTGFGATNADGPWLLRRHQAYRDTPVATWNSWLDSAANDARPRWLIAFSHQCNNTPGFYDCTPAVLNTHLQYLYNSYGAGGLNNVWVAPSDEVLHYIVTRVNCSCALVPAPTPSRTPSATRTSTPGGLATATRTPSPSATPPASPTRTGTMTRSPTGTPSHTAPVSASPSRTPSPTPSRSATPSSTLSPTRSSSPTPSHSATSTWTASSTPTASPAPSASASGTPSWTATLSPSLTSTLTAASTQTSTGTRTRTPSPPGTPSSTPTRSPTPTETVSPSLSPSLSATLSPSPAQSSTATPTLSLTLSSTSSPGLTSTGTLTGTPTPAASGTPSPVQASATVSATPSFSATNTSLPAPSQPFELLDAALAPNPGPQVLALHLRGSSGGGKLRLYTPAHFLVMEQRLGPCPPGRSQWALQNWETLSDGLYYWKITMDEGGSRLGKILVLK